MMIQQFLEKFPLFVTGHRFSPLKIIAGRVQLVDTVISKTSHKISAEAEYLPIGACC